VAAPTGRRTVLAKGRRWLQKETNQVTIMNAKGEAVTLNFEINTHLPVKKSFVW
jgi:hypothetical protein